MNAFIQKVDHEKWKEFHLTPDEKASFGEGFDVLQLLVEFQTEPLLTLCYLI